MLRQLLPGMDPQQLLTLQRAVFLLLPAALAVVLWSLRPPPWQRRAGLLLACLWNAVVLLAVNLAALRMGLWHFGAADAALEGGLIEGIPVDVWLGRVVLWGLLPGLIAPKRGILWVVAVVVVADVLWMPLLEPLVVLERGWWLGEGAGLALGLVPGEWLRRWTEQQRRLPLRVLMQVACFGALTFGVIGLTVRTMTNDVLWPPPVRPAWLHQLSLQLWGLLSLMALSTVHEFYQRGHGTPLPYDAPRRLVTSGLYRYVANPMQLLMLLTMLAFAWLTASVGYLVATGVAFCFSAGIANWQEAQHLRGRHGGGYDDYRRQVAMWWPRWRPASQPLVRATLGYDGGCGMCREVGGWLKRRVTSGLQVAPVQTLGRGDAGFDWMACRRITYVERAADGTAYVTSGVAALLRGLEHIHLGWALFAAPLRLPGVVQLLGLVVDVSGGGPRRATAAVAAVDAQSLVP